MSIVMMIFYFDMEVRYLNINIIYVYKNMKNFCYIYKI